MAEAHDIQGLLAAWRGWDWRALEGPIRLLERELHRITWDYMPARPEGHTLQTIPPVTWRI